MTTGVDVLVVGGGPAGSATSLLLARQGWRVVLVDRAVFPRPKPCGDYVNPGSDAVLERLGVRAAVAAAAAPTPGMRLVTADGRAVPLRFPVRTGWSIARMQLDHLLLEHTARAGTVVRDGCRVVGVEPDARAVRVTVRHGAREHRYVARLVIGADGLRSTVARAAGILSPVRTGRYTVGAYVEGVSEAERDPVFDAAPAIDQEHDAAGRLAACAARWGEIHLRAHGYCGVAHLPGGLANVTLAVPRSVLGAWRDGIEAGYWRWLRECPGLRDRLAHARRVGPFTAVGPLGFHVRSVGRGRVLLTGDSAAHADPMTGQGVYLALRGAELCAEAASGALYGTSMPSLRTYAAARWREFAPVFAAGRLVQLIAFRQRAVRRVAAQLARHPDLRARLIEAVGNTRHPGAVLAPAVLPRLLGWA